MSFLQLRGEGVGGGGGVNTRTEILPVVLFVLSVVH